jgi:hypothetical protein
MKNISLYFYILRPISEVRTDKQASRQFFFQDSSLRERELASREKFRTFEQTLSKIWNFQDASPFHE